MKHRRSWSNRCEALLAAVLLAACQSSPSAPTASSAGAPSKPTPPVLSLPFVEAVTGGAERNAALPLVVALHGLGDRPENFIGLFSDFPIPARIVAPHSRTPYSDGFAWFPPGSPMSDDSAPAIGDAADGVARFIEEAAKARPTLGKPIVLGFSQGGALSYAVAVRHPNAVSAGMPISGWLPPPLWPHELPQNAPPIFAFHGTVDSRVPLERDKAGADALQRLGFKMDFRVFEGVEHAIPPPVRQIVFVELATACEEQRRAAAR